MKLSIDVASNEEVIAATLEWCNDVREAQGKEPLIELPKGYKSDPLSCPCGAATGLAVLREFVVSERDYRTRNSRMKYSDVKLYDLPSLVQEFTLRFDEGRFPQFDADA